MTYHLGFREMFYLPPPLKSLEGKKQTKFLNFIEVSYENYTYPTLQPVIFKKVAYFSLRESILTP